MTALELTALALISRLLSGQDDAPAAESSVISTAPELERATQGEVEWQAHTDDTDDTDETTFITESAGEDSRYYRAVDESGEVLAGFYADGRVRLAGSSHRFAGMVQNGRADLLEITENTWSELFVRVTPEGGLELELRGGPFNGRVLSCEAVRTQTAQDMA